MASLNSYDMNTKTKYSRHYIPDDGYTNTFAKNVCVSPNLTTYSELAEMCKERRIVIMNKKEPMDLKLSFADKINQGIASINGFIIFS